MPKDSRAASLATRLTFPGRGAVAVVSVEGLDAVAYVAQHFVSAIGKPLASFPVDRVVFGRWKQSQEDGEEIVVCRTGERAIEVHCHGGMAAVRAIVTALVADGAIEQTPESWAIRNSRDLIEAEGWLALAEARTERTAAILLDQHRGALRRAIHAAIDELKTGQSAAAQRRLATLLKRADIGLHLTKPWRVAFAGPPNVGKSSLMNCLLGYERSIVFDQPGTTRDLLSAPAALEGWALELTDTAGLREGQDAVEVEGVTRATSFLAAADLTVLVFDVTCEGDSRQTRLLEQYPQSLLVANKCDLRDGHGFDQRFLLTSALTRAGVPELMQQIVRRLVRCELASGDGVPFTSRQVQALDAAYRAIDDGQIVNAIETLETIAASPVVATEV